MIVLVGMVEMEKCGITVFGFIFWIFIILLYDLSACLFRRFASLNIILILFFMFYFLIPNEIFITYI